MIWAPPVDTVSQRVTKGGAGRQTQVANQWHLGKLHLIPESHSITITALISHTQKNAYSGIEEVKVWF